MNVPISAKMAVITILILISATAPIAIVTSTYFEKTFREREENVNLDYASSLSLQVDAILSDLTRRARTAGVSLVRNAGEESEDFRESFMSDSSLLAIEVQRADGLVVKRKVKNDLIKTLCKCDPKIIGTAHLATHFPVDAVKQDQIEVQNTTVRGGPPIFTIGIPLAKSREGKVTHIVLADFDLSLFKKPFGQAQERTFFAVDRRGTVIGYSEESRLLAREDFSDQEIVKIAASSTLARGQKHVLDSLGAGPTYAAYSMTRFGIAVFSQISDKIILEPAREIRRRVYFIAGLVLSLALFVIFVFSSSLTAPIEKLAKLTESISKGNFDVKASSVVKSIFKDEVGKLAEAFDQMMDGLRERDKVKLLFTKFHGSSVTEDLIGRKTALEGQSKDVLVFFSDIRGFTSFSESREAKDVFAMLNEYFQEMVAVVNAHGGVVDKFIGDAIMAVWGAPKSSPDDSRNAVMACLKMRQALNTLNERRVGRGEPPLMIGMGLHAGLAISGIIGSEERMEYTVIGNTVNTTSRVEAATKTFGTDFLVTDEIVARVGQDFKYELAGSAKVKGRSEPLKLFKVSGYIDKATGGFVEVRTPYSEYEAEADDKVKAEKTPTT